MAIPARVEAYLRSAPATPAPDAGARPKSRRGDGWTSLLTGIGTDRDKRTSATFGANFVLDTEARELWRGDDLATRAIEDYPAEMMRAGWELKIAVDDDDADAQVARDDSEAMVARLEELDADLVVQKALEYERAFGGAAIMPVGNPGRTDFASPLPEGEGLLDIRALQVFEPRELQALTFYSDPAHPKFGKPATYRLQPTLPAGGFVPSMVVHESRLIIFPGVQTSRGAITQYPGWGDNVLSRVSEVLRDFNLGFAAVSHILNDFSQAIFTIQGLHDAVANDEEDVIVTRMRLMDMARSIIRGIMLDAGGEGQPAETFHRETTSITGIPETLDRLMMRLAAALEEPVTLLMGRSPSGLNATGDGDLAFWYQRVGRKQNKDLKPRLSQLVQMLFRCTSGPTHGAEPENWSICFRPLTVATQASILADRKAQLEIDKMAAELGASADELLESRFGGDDFSFDTKLDFDSMKIMREAVAERASEMSALRRSPPALGQGKPPAPGAGESDADLDALLDEVLLAA